MRETGDYTGSPADARAPRVAATLAVIWCVVILLLARGAASIPGGAPSPWGPGDTAQAPPLARFDAGWFRTIALRGYADPEAARFYPLQPLAAGALSRFAGIPFFDAATGLSLACVLLAAILCARTAPRGAAGPMAFAALLFYPTSFFLAAPTSDALFLATVAAAFAAARQGRWALAGIAGVLAALTRAQGLLLALPLALAEPRRGGRPASRPRSRWIAAGAVLAAGALFPLFIALRFGDPTLAWRAPQGSSAPFWKLPWEVFREMAHRLREPGAGGKLVFAMAIGSLALFALLAGVAWRRGDRSGALFSLAALLFLLGRGSTHGIQREVLALLPCYFPLADALSRRLSLAFGYALVGAGLGTLLLARFVLWIPVE